MPAIILPVAVDVGRLSFDGLVSAAVRDPAGRSGAFVGQELDIRVRWALLPAAELDVQFGRLFAGGFLKRTGQRAGERVFLVGLTARLP
ncbi:MAG: alginate export family protein [Acidobacteria bacterium]|nr:alginate export family protein [Acidobacteriota bacterium]